MANLSTIDRALSQIPAPAPLYVLLFIAYALITLLALAATIRLIRAGRMESAFFVAAALISLYVLISAGSDTVHHVLRVEALADEIRRGDFGPLIENPETGEVVPVFLYYSVVPYIAPVALTFLGVSSRVALQLALLLEFLLFCGSVHALIAKTAPVEGRQRAFGAALLLVGANYVVLDWILRAALAEVFAYALLPLAILYSRDGKSYAKLVFVFFLQIAAHPLVFPFGFVGYFMAAYLIYERSLVALAKFAAPACVVALAMAAPFWAPQVLFMGDVLGTKGLPLQFASSFQRPLKLLDPLSTLTVGPTLIVACAAIFAIALRERQFKWAAGTAAFFAILLLQTDLLRDLVARAPLLNETQFVWRLMFPCALVAFAAVMIFAVRSGNAHERALAGLSVVAALLLALKLSTGLVRSVGDVQGLLAPSPWTLGSYFVNFADDSTRIFGVRLFSPDYASLGESCGEPDDGAYSAVSYAELRKPAPAKATYIGVEAGPIGFVRYLANGADIGVRHCGQTLVLGPIERGAVVSADESRLNGIQFARLFALVASSLGVAALSIREAILRRTGRRSL